MIGLSCIQVFFCSLFQWQFSLDGHVRRRLVSPFGTEGYRFKVFLLWHLCIFFIFIFNIFCLDYFACLGFLFLIFKFVLNWLNLCICKKIGFKHRKMSGKALYTSIWGYNFVSFVFYLLQFFWPFMHFFQRISNLCLPFIFLFLIFYLYKCWLTVYFRAFCSEFVQRRLLPYIGFSLFGLTLFHNINWIEKI